MNGQSNTSNLWDAVYIDAFADAYDHLFAGREDLDLISHMLARLAGDGPVLEFGIGTGRLAIPLARRSIQVYGIDNSLPMLRKLREKPEAATIVAVFGDCTTDVVRPSEGGTFSLVFAAFSTLFALGSQETQVRCFQNAARHLGPGGLFLVEGFNHDRTQWQRNQETTVMKIDKELVSMRFGLLDPVTQQLTIQYLDFTPSGIRFRLNVLRFVYPSEMDMMARHTGFRLRERWSDWSGAPFVAGSNTQIAIYEKLNNDDSLPATDSRSPQ